MEYQKNSPERRHTEVYTWCRNFRIYNLEDWFYYYDYAWLWLMLFQLLHLIPTRFLIFCQYAQEWTCGVLVKLRKHYVVLLVPVANLKEDRSAFVVVVHQALEAASTVHCQNRNRINDTLKENRDWRSRKLFSFIHNNIFSKNLKWIINFADVTFKKDDLTNWSPSREKLRTNKLALSLLQQDCFQRETCPYLLDN